MLTIAQILQHLQSTPVSEQWREIGIRHHHGINLPLFSLHSSHSCGIGEFTDLPPLFDWCNEIGFDTIQLLPLNDTGPERSPYSALSAFALNPIHLGLTQLENIQRHPKLLEEITQLQQISKDPRIDYSVVRRAKYRFLRSYFQYECARIAESPAFLAFIQKNPWLTGYAVFKALKVKKNWQGYQQWEAHLRQPGPETIEQLCNELRDEVDFHLTIQFLCFEQFQQVADVAREKGIFLKGDIPILIGPESADVWLHPNIFRRDLTAGSPPDIYTPEGQNWGAPIYNWEALEQTDFLWWKQRLQVSEKLYDLCRLDHIIGFFRIWAIPPGKSALEGQYLPPDRETWLEHGSRILTMMGKNTSMLPIGEDLGDIPLSIHNFLKELGICGTKVMRWEREISSTEGPYIPGELYHPVSMTTVSTHDAETLHMWWEQYPIDAKVFADMKGWSYRPELTPDQHFSILRDSHHTGSLFHINLLQEYLAMFPELRWEDASIERVNYPGTVSDKNWTSRYKPSVESIVANENLKSAIKNLIK